MNSKLKWFLKGRDSDFKSIASVIIVLMVMLFIPIFGIIYKVFKFANFLYFIFFVVIYMLIFFAFFMTTLKLMNYNNITIVHRNLTMKFFFIQVVYLFICFFIIPLLCGIPEYVNSFFLSIAFFILFNLICIGLYRVIRGLSKNTSFPLQRIITGIHSLKKRTNKYFILVFLIIINAIIIALYVYIYTYKNLEWMLIVIASIYNAIVIFVIGLVYYPFSNDSENMANKIKINFMNLDFNDVVQRKVYINNSFSDYNLYRFFKISPDKELLTKSDKEIKNIQIKIINHPYVSYINNPIDDDQYCYLAIDALSPKQSAKIDFAITFEERISTIKLFKIILRKEKYVKKVRRIVVILETIKIDNELVVTKKYVPSYYENKCYSSYKTMEWWDKEKFKKEHFYQLNYQFYQYNELVENNVLTKVIIGPRKWVHHEGNYGVGKTSLDVLGASELGYNPVVISPWVTNYDADLLSLVFENVSKRSKRIFHWPNKSVFVFFAAQVIAFSSFIFMVFNWLLEIIYTMFIINPEWQKIISPIEEIIKNAHRYKWIASLDTIIISIIIALFLAAYFLPRIILFKKDSTKLYQTFYLKEIVDMIIKEKMILVVEDVDRLNGEALDNMFRTISAINNICAINNVNRIVGIVSYDRGNIQRLMKTSRHNNILDDVEEKVIYSEIFDNYNYAMSLYTYLKKSIDALLNMKNGKKECHIGVKYKLMKVDLKALNFRTVHKFIDECLELEELNENNIIMKLNDLERKMKVERNL